MPDDPTDIETRLRDHLERVAMSEPRPGLEQRIQEHVHRGGAPKQRWAPAFAMAFVIVVVMTTLILLTVGHQVNNVFSNISNGLNQ